VLVNNLHVWLIPAETSVVALGFSTSVAAVPVPSMFCALTRNEYLLPRVKPVTIVDAFVETPSGKVAQFVESEEYSIK
jgi:hypothetical protein